jgi:hypothetical protein
MIAGWKWIDVYTVLLTYLNLKRSHRGHSAAAGRNLKNLQEAAEDAEKSDIILLSLLTLRSPVPKSCQNYTIPQVCNTEITEV